MNDLVKYIIITYLILPSTISKANEKNLFIDEELSLIKIVDSIYIHISLHALNHSQTFSSNGLLIVRNKEAILVDTPMDNEKTKRLIAYISDSMGIVVKHFIGTHHHNDCIGGLSHLKSIGVESYAHKKTIELCKSKGLAVPNIALSDSVKWNFNGLPVICCYFGGGHAKDNCVVYLPKQKVLFGGCLVRAAGTKGLGNTNDANVKKWDETVSKLQNALPDAKIVIPGHGAFGGKNLLAHTIKLVQSAKENGLVN